MLVAETHTLPFPPATLSPDDRLRFARYAEARDFFEGAQWLGRPRRGETRLTFNYARAVVRKTAATSSRRRSPSPCRRRGTRRSPMRPSSVWPR